MRKRDRILTALGGVLGCAVYLMVVHLWGNGVELGSAPVPADLTGLALAAGLGCMAGLATRPFADDGATLVRQSVGHYLLTTALFAALIWTLGGRGKACVVWSLVMTGLYLCIWMARWIGWYLEVVQLRRLLGLSPGPSPLKWQETAPYLPFVLVLYDGLPLLAWLIDRWWSDVPLFSGTIVPMVLVPVAGFVAGLSLGKRQGVCPLYPAVCLVCYLPAVWLLTGGDTLSRCLLAVGSAVLGNVLGWLYRRAVPRKRGAAQ